jgi:hypothetical protein
LRAQSEGKFKLARQWFEQSAAKGDQQLRARFSGFLASWIRCFANQFPFG